MDENPTTFAVYEIHVFPPDPYTTPWGDARATFYGGIADGIPWFAYDGLWDAWPIANYESNLHLRMAVPTDVTVDLTGVETGTQTYDVTAHVCVEPGGVGKTMRIYMVHALDHWPADPSYERNTLRQGATTEDVTVGAGECADVTRTFVFDATSWAQQSDIKIVAWAQTPATAYPAEVHQAKVMGWPFPGPAQQADLGITKDDGVTQVMYLQAVTYSIVVSNAGPADVTGATVADTFPATLTAVSWTCVGAGGGVCSPSGSGDISQSVGLPVGASVTFTATGTFTGTSGTLENTATVTPPVGIDDPVATDNSATDTDTMTAPAQADLTLRLSSDPCTVTPGSALQYSIEVANPGPSAVAGATVTDLFPTELSNVSWTCSASSGASCSWSGTGNIDHDLVNLPVDGSVTYTVDATLDPGAIGWLVNQAQVECPAGTADINPADNTGAHVDPLAPGDVFCDSVETGDTSGWSSALP